jgi:hypothetical protein
MAQTFNASGSNRLQEVASISTGPQKQFCSEFCSDMPRKLSLPRNIMTLCKLSVFCGSDVNFREEHFSSVVNGVISDNVGDVNCFLSVVLRALRRARHFALVEKVPYPTQTRFQSVAGQELSLTHASLRSTTSIMIASSNSPRRGAGCPIDLLGDLVHSNACSGLARVQTELFQLLVIPLLAPHPVQVDG